MSSKNIYSQDLPYTPYFYVIKHSKTGMKYAGSRWRTRPTKFSINGAHPSELLKEKGYLTSCNRVARTIEAEGIDSFEILDIITLDEIKIPFGWQTIYDFERSFLIENNCAKSQDWINSHNNHTIIDVAVKQKYGEFNVMKVKEIKEKSMKNAKKATKEKYGVDFILQNKEFKKKQQQTCDATVLERYGVTTVFKLEEIKEKTKKTLMEKYGVDSIAKTPKRVEYRSNKNLELKECEWCKRVVKNATYFGNHGKFCKANPDKTPRSATIQMMNIETKEFKLVTNRNEIDPKIWKPIVTIKFDLFDQSGSHIVTCYGNDELRTFLESRDIPSISFIAKTKRSDTISASDAQLKSNKNWIQCIGWKVVRTKLNSLMPEF